MSDKIKALFNVGDAVLILAPNDDDSDSTDLKPTPEIAGKLGKIAEVFTYYTLNTDYDVEVDGDLYVVDENYLASAEGE